MSGWVNDMSLIPWTCWPVDLACCSATLSPHSALPLQTLTAEYLPIYPMLGWSTVTPCTTAQSPIPATLVTTSLVCPSSVTSSISRSLKLFAQMIVSGTFPTLKDVKVRTRFSDISSEHAILLHSGRICRLRWQTIPLLELTFWVFRCSKHKPSRFLLMTPEFSCFLFSSSFSRGVSSSEWILLESSHLHGYSQHLRCFRGLVLQNGFQVSPTQRHLYVRDVPGWWVLGSNANFMLQYVTSHNFGLKNI